MARIRIAIGIVFLATLVSALTQPRAGHAAESSSFKLYDSQPGYGEASQQESTTFRANGGTTWTQQPLQSQSFTITKDKPAASSAGASSTSSTSSDAASSASSAATQGGDGGGRRSSSGAGSSAPRSPDAASSSDASSRGFSSAPSSQAASSAQEGRGATSSSASRSGLPGAVLRPAAPLPADGPSVTPDGVPGPMRDPASGSPHASDPAEPETQGPEDAKAWSIITSAAEASFAGAAASVLWVAISNQPLTLLPFMFIRAKGGKRKRHERWHRRAGRMAARVLLSVLFSLLATLLLWMLMEKALAASTAPATRVYNGHLLSSANEPITTPHTIRFSYWNSADFVTGDTTGGGAINTSASTYVGWNEVHTVTPDSNGFFSVQLGSVNALPDPSSLSAATLLSLFLQVEVKASASADTAYELLDVNGSDTAVDRSPVLSVPFARNADFLDQRDVGTGSGAIPFLQSGGLLPVSAVPGGTNRDFFTIDADSTAASSITLTFGASLAKTLTYDIANARFDFNASVRVQGDLTVTGLINGVDIASLGTVDSYLRVSSGAGLSVLVSSGSYRINGGMKGYGGSSGLSVQDNATNYLFLTGTGISLSTAGYPSDKSFVPLAEVSTSGGSIARVVDKRTLLSDDREDVHEEALHPEFKSVAYVADGSSNVGQLSISHDDAAMRNFYSWTSTKATAQDYDVILKYRLPEQFLRWEDSLSVTYRSTSASGALNALEIQMFDTNGAAVTLSGSTTNLASTTWATQHVEFTGSPAWAPGQDVTIKFRLSAKENAQMHLGTVHLSFRKLNSR